MRRQPLDNNEKEQCLKDAAYRLNCMLTYDLFLFIQNKYKNKKSVYATGHVLEPVMEISAVFGRQLLEFLKIKKDRKSDSLRNFDGSEVDDITIDLYSPSMKDFPLAEQIIKENEIHLVRLIKVANKATAHFTRNQTTDEEFESMKIARMVIYELILKYLPELTNLDIRWRDRENYLDAKQE